jgi:hypothetical protein
MSHSPPSCRKPQKWPAVLPFYRVTFQRTPTGSVVVSFFLFCFVISLGLGAKILRNITMTVRCPWLRWQFVGSPPDSSNTFRNLNTVSVVPGISRGVWKSKKTTLVFPIFYIFHESITRSRQFIIFWQVQSGSFRNTLTNKLSLRWFEAICETTCLSECVGLLQSIPLFCLCR